MNQNVINEVKIHQVDLMNLPAHQRYRARVTVECSNAVRMTYWVIGKEGEDPRASLPILARMTGANDSRPLNTFVDEVVESAVEAIVVEAYLRQKEIEVREALAAFRFNPQAAYREYLKTQHWRDKRAEAFQRRGTICERCQQRAAIQVHHLCYDHLGDEDVDRDLMVVCPWCHQVLELKKQNGKPK